MKPVHRITAILLVLALAAFAAIGLVEAATAAPAPVYHQAASGRTVTVAVGERVKVDLRASSGTAYRWVVVKGKHAAPFKIVSRRTYSGASGIPGAPYHTVWTLKGRAVGYATFKVVLRSVVDGNVARRFTLHLHVVPASM
ncbi:MAG: protease inhibitor I42 family protein [Marmoricola sp.]